MRYWVYKDSQILGPLAKEDLGLVGGARPETLVCAEDNAGRMDVDWRCAEEIGELSSLCAAAPAAVDVDTLLEPGFGLLERLQSETLALPGEGGGEGWLTDIFSPASRIPAADLPQPDEATRQELKDSQARIQELTAQLELLNRRLAELEAAPRQAPVPLKKAPAAAPPQAPAPAQKAPAAPPSAAAPPVLAPLPKVDVPAPEHIKSPVQDGPALSPEESPYRWDTQPVMGGSLPQAGSAPPPAEAPAPESPYAAPESPPTLKGRPRRLIKFSAPQTLRRVGKGSPPSLPAADKSPAGLPPPPTTAPGLKPEESPYQWGPQPTPTANLPQAGSAPLPAPITAGPAPIELSAPPATIVPGAFPPPQPVLSPPPATFMQPLTAPPTGSMLEMPPLQPPPSTLSVPARGMEVPPVPTLAPTAPTPAALPPMTMAFSGGAAMPAPTAGPSTQQVLAKLAKPAPAKTEPPTPPKSRSKTFPIIIGLASVVVIAAGWFFLFRDSKGLNTALRMDSGRAPVGAEVPDGPAGIVKPDAAAPAPQAAQPAPPAVPATQSGAAAPSTAPPAPTPQAEAIRDERPAAVTLVKEFPLDGDRGTIGQWLQYSFAATPGAQNEEKWDAGAYEETTYAVKYTVQPAGKDAITYLFEADLARKTVKGMNVTARELLAGRSPTRGKATAKARPANPKKRTPPRRTVAPAPIPKEVPLLPLPSDAELTPPAEDESAFRSDTVQSNL